MFAIHWASLLIGLFIGVCIGSAVVMFATLKVMENNSEFSDGFNRGWESGREHQELMFRKQKEGDRNDL